MLVAAIEQMFFFKKKTIFQAWQTMVEQSDCELQATIHNLFFKFNSATYVDLDMCVRRTFDKVSYCFADASIRMSHAVIDKSDTQFTQ